MSKEQNLVVELWVRQGRERDLLQSEIDCPTLHRSQATQLRLAQRVENLNTECNSLSVQLRQIGCGRLQAVRPAGSLRAA
jgi:hypothetical protein